MNTLWIAAFYATVIMLVSGIQALRAHCTGKDPTTAVTLFRLTRHEIALWTDLIRLVSRRIELPADATALPSTKGLWTIPGAVTGATIIEVMAIELLLSNLTARILITVISLYSLILLYAYFGRTIIYPSYLTPAGYVLKRHGATIAEIPQHMVKKCSTTRSYEVAHWSIDGATLILGGTEGTNHTIELSAEVMARASTYPWQKAQWRPVRTIQLWIDP